MFYISFVSSNMLFITQQSGPVDESDKRQRLAEAAEQRMKQQQMRGVIGNSGGAPLRTAHAELPGNVDSNLRWQTS